MYGNVPHLGVNTPLLEGAVTLRKLLRRPLPPRFLQQDHSRVPAGLHGFHVPDARLDLPNVGPAQ